MIGLCTRRSAAASWRDSGIPYEGRRRYGASNHTGEVVIRHMAAVRSDSLGAGCLHSATDMSGILTRGRSGVGGRRTTRDALPDFAPTTALHFCHPPIPNVNQTHKHLPYRASL